MCQSPEAGVDGEEGLSTRGRQVVGMGLQKKDKNQLDLGRPSAGSELGTDSENWEMGAKLGC